MDGCLTSAEAAAACSQPAAPSGPMPRATAPNLPLNRR